MSLIYTGYFFLPNLVSFLSSSRKMEMKLFLCVSFSNGFSPSRRRGSWETVLEGRYERSEYLRRKKKK